LAREVQVCGNSRRVSASVFSLKKKMLPGGGILCSFTEKRLRDLLLMKRHRGIFHGNSFEDREMIWHRFQLAQASNSEAN
jgi:hypothetical protein